MSRTIKTDQPPLKVTVEGGRLIPASAYDAERLDTYRRGTTLNVFITHEKQRVDEKKWWASINRAVKECKTPWQNSAQASEAIKLALGIVNLSKTIGGDFMAYPKSLTELGDPDLEEAVRGLFDVLYRVTGVDPEEWRRQVSEIREDQDDEPSSVPPSEDAGSGTSEPPAEPAAEPISSQERGEEAGGHEAGDVPAAAPASEALKRECLDKFMALATDADLDVKARRENLAFAKDAWKETAIDLDFVRACLSTADKVAKGELGAAPARKYLEGLL